MKAGTFQRVIVCIDPRPIVTASGTETHAVLFARSKPEVDRLLTDNLWTHNNGFYYAPNGWGDVRLILPNTIKLPFVPGLFVRDFANQRQDFLFCGTSEVGARRWAQLFGWRKKWGLWTHG